MPLDWERARPPEVLAGTALDRPILFDALPADVARALIGRGVRTYRELAELPYAQVLQTKELGRVAIREIDAELIRIGLRPYQVPSVVDYRPVEKPWVQPSTTGVYFWTCGTWVKIGWALNIRKRIQGLAAATPYPASLEAVIRTPTKEDAQRLERELHVRFRHLRHRGEWFKQDPAIWACLEEYAGTTAPDRR